MKHNQSILVGLLLLTVGSGPIGAAPRNLARMKAVAATALQSRQELRVLHEREKMAVVGTAGGGFVVVSDEAEPVVLGVSPHSVFSEDNENLQWWLSAMSEALSRGQKPVAKVQGAPIEPLVKTQWGQGAPYNNLCPVGADGTRCLTGCVATSTAQLMNYYGLPLRGQGSATIYYPVEDVSGTPVYAHFGATWYDWSHIRDSYKDADYTAEEAAAVAELMLHAGVSADMAYGTDAEGGSGANSQRACENLKRYFGFTDVRYVNRADFTEEAWMQMVYEQLSQYGPIVYDGDDQRGGHSFIIDGYREDGLVHVNWGYEGSGDGYYDIATLRPSFSAGGYADNQDMMLVRVPRDEERITSLDLSGLQLTDGLLPERVCYGNPYLLHVVLPAGITRWGDGALGACPSLRTVELPETTDRQFVVVDDYLICNPDTTELIAVLSAATGCVRVPSTVTAIHSNAFDGCVGIDTLELPAVSTIGGEALRGCGGLKLLRLRAKTPPALSGHDTFAGLWLDACRLLVPSGTKTTYSRRAQWKDFTLMEEFGTTIRANNVVRKQYEPNPEFGYTMSGDVVDGKPYLYTDATPDSPPGVYTIFVEPGTITAPYVEYVSGRLIVEENTEGISETKNYELRTMNYYDLQGRRVVNSQSVKSSNSQMPKGIIVSKGKKVLRP